MSSAKYVLLVSMDVDADREALFNEVYDTEHVPLLAKVPGVGAITRWRSEPLTMTVAGETRTVSAPEEPRYTAMYEIDDPSVLTSQAWADAVDQGRWPTDVRPYTRNRRHVLKKRC